MSPPAARSGEILSWDEVNRTHRIRNGVYQRNGRLVSLLTDFGRINPCYPDRSDSSGDRIYYTGAGRRGDQPLSPANRALLDAIKMRHAVPLFNKLAVGRWQHMGHWRVIAGHQLFNEQEQRMLWQFTLERVKNSDKRRVTSKAKRRAPKLAMNDE
ncbi:MAG: hypothetical protein QOF02_3486 [Blastocatellia bacterium]|jgi:hypothetical protein|nr:hypothetical protein [Blastocatellia bacterium]